MDVVAYSRFNRENYEGFVKARKPTQVVCNLPEAVDGKCLEIDVRSCRLNGIVEGNVQDIPIFSPLDEFTKPVEGIIADYSWVDLGKSRAPSLHTYMMVLDGMTGPP